jgi:hypothetical protein
MGQHHSKRTAEQRLAFEHKVGAGVIIMLLGIFFFVLSMRLGGFGWGDETVEVNLGGPNAQDVASAGFSNSATASRHGAPGFSGAAATPYSPPQVYLPPSPPPVVATYPLPKAAAPRATVPVVPPPVAPPTSPMPSQLAEPRPVNPAAAVGDRYATLTIAPPTSPAAAAATGSVVHATPPARETAAPTIGLVAGTAPVAPPQAPGAPPTFNSQASLPVPSSAAAPQVHVFAEGDNYWTIAQKAYGDGAYYRALFAYNQDRYPHPEDLRPGDKVDVPSLAELRSKFPQLCTPAGVANGR